MLFPLIVGSDDYTAYMVKDLLNNEQCWKHGYWNYVKLDSRSKSAHVFRIEGG